MSMFSIMDIGRTGVGFSRYWMDALAHNMANVNTVNPAGEEPFRARMVAAKQLGPQPFAPTGSGVAVAAVAHDGREAPVTYDPTNPLADENGLVTLPVVDMAGQMTDLIIANRSYQMNLKSIETGREAYQAALRLGQR
jgi:flagellar basal-body rod protein FlgC